MADGNNQAGFRETLLQATAQRRSGLLEVSTGIEEIGTVVLVEGELAWACCIYQPEDLGTFLVRLGHVSHDDLAEVRVAYNRAGGRKKLGRLLEEAGLVSRPVLRTCLLRHIRMALACMLRKEDLDLLGEWRPGPKVMGEELTVALREVLPEWEVPETVPVGGVHRVPDGTAGFDDFESIPGYRGAVVAGSNGSAIVLHGPDVDQVSEPTLLGTISLNMLENVARSASLPDMGRLEAVYLEGVGGLIVARWIDTEHRFLVAMVFSAGAKVGSAKHRLAASLPDIHEYISHLGNPAGETGP